PRGATSSLVLESLRLDVPPLVPPGGLELVLRGGQDPRGRVVQIASNAGLHLAAHVPKRASSTLAPLSPETMRVFDRRGPPTNGDALAADLGRPLHVAELWVHAPSYDQVVGCARFRHATAQRRRAILLDT